MIFGGYKTEDGAYKMVRGCEKEFEFSGSGGIYTSGEIEVTGADKLQCIIWQGEKLISVATENI